MYGESMYIYLSLSIYIYLSLPLSIYTYIFILSQEETWIEGDKGRKREKERGLALPFSLPLSHLRTSSGGDCICSVLHFPWVVYVLSVRMCISVAGYRRQKQPTAVTRLNLDMQGENVARKSVEGCKQAVPNVHPIREKTSLGTQN